MNGKTFAQEFEDAVNKLSGNTKDAEMGRVHQEMVRDGQHAFRNVEIKKPEPWKNRSDLTI